MDRNKKADFSFIYETGSYELKAVSAWSLIYIYEGQRSFCADAETKSFASDQLLLLRPGAGCRFSAETDKTRLGICVCRLPEMLVSELIDRIKSIPELSGYAFLSDKPRMLQLADDRYGNIKKFLWCAAHEYGHYAGGSGEMIVNCLYLAFISIARLYEESLDRAPAADARDSGMNALMMYIRSNFGGDMSLRALAERAHLSEGYLSRTFKKHTGKTVADFVLEIRMNEAKRRLMSTTYSVYDISVYCGYQSLNTFERAFKKYTGMTPAEYRKNAFQ